MAHSKVNVTIYNIHTDFQRIQREWCRFCQLTTPSFFLSWAWIESWIKCLPKEIPVFLVTLSDPDMPKIAFFIGAPPSTPPFAGLKRLYLNSTGISIFDKLYIEYNSILVENDKEVPVDVVLSYLPFNWDEFVMPGLDPVLFPGNVIESSGSPYNIVTKKVASPFVDLIKVRDNKFDYLGLLSGNTRSQIRRSYRMYQKEGNVKLKVAATLEQAINIFTELIHLHQGSWQRRGEQGCFSSDFFMKFHRRLIKKYFSKGNIQLATLCCGEKTIACIYNFVEKNNVCFYQSGLETVENNKYKPGLMIHAEAIKYNAMLGHGIYDFLAGLSQYKKSLSTDEKQLIWARIQKKNIKNYGYNFAKNIYFNIKRNLFR